MLQLAEILHSHGFSITVVHAQFNSPNPSMHPHFTFCPISDGFVREGEASEADVVSLLCQLNITFVEPFRDCMVRLLSDAEEEPIACLITDAIWSFTQAVSDPLKLPRIVLRTSSISSFLAFAAFPLLRDRGYLPVQESQLEAPVPELSPLKVKDLPVIKTSENDDIDLLLENMIKSTRVSSGLIWNSFEDLEKFSLSKLEQDFPIPIFPIGPFHKHTPASSGSLLTQDRTSLSWLDKQRPKSVLYVSFGSIATLDETEFLEIAWGLANSQQAFLWVVRPGLVCGSGWLELLPKGFMEEMGERGYIVKWAPQEEVLAHPSIGAFWTHNGWNSTLESICEGVPMICFPCFGDQMVNARYVSDVWRVGVRLENGIKRQEIEKAIRRIFVEKEGEEMRNRALSLKEKTNMCTRDGGSSDQSLKGLITYILSF